MNKAIRAAAGRPARQCRQTTNASRPRLAAAWVRAAVTVTVGLLAINTAAAPVSSSPPDDGPFDVLEWRDGVTTSRNGDAVWASATPIGHSAQIPGYARPAGPPGHHVAFGVSCRAAEDDLAEDFAPRPATGEIWLDNHPEHPGVYLVWHPMYWLLELRGQAVEAWPVTVRIGDRPAIEATLERPRVDYSAPHPGLTIAVRSEAALTAMLGKQPITVTAAGPDFALEARFKTSRHARRAAELMETECP